MIQLDINDSTLKKLVDYHTNYIKNTVSENWNQIKGKNIAQKAVSQDEMNTIKDALNRKLAKNNNSHSDNILLENIANICTTKNLRKYAIESEDLFPAATERYVNILLEIIGYRKFNKGDVSGRYNNGIVWNRHTFVQSLNVRVCPYCNRQYITSFYKNGDRKLTTADVDHYYPKTQYPLLSMNFFNMIPSCSICNSGLKGRKKLKLNDMTLNPFFDDSDSLFFQINNDELGELYSFRNSDIKISTIVNKAKSNESQKRAEKSIEIFYLPEIYNAHVEDARTIKENINHFSRYYFENVFQKNYQELFNDYEDFEKTIFHFNNLNDGDEPIVKFKKDIYRQLNIGSTTV